MAGWVAIHRKLLDDVVWKKSTPEQKTVLMAVLLLVDHKPNEWEWGGVKFKTNPGQTVTSLTSIVKACGKGITTQNVRSALKRFKKLQFLTDEATKSGRLITVINWGSYQGIKTGCNKEGNKEVTKTQQRPNKDLTPNNNVTTKQHNNKYIYPENYSNELKDKLNDFIENRKAMKSPMTENAIKLLIGKIEKFSNGNQGISISMLDDAIINNWKSVYEPKNNQQKGNFDFLKDEA